MSWIEVRARFSPAPEDWSPFIDLYDQHGIENTLEEGEELVGAIAGVDAGQTASQALREALLAAGAVEVNVQELPEVNWQEAWKQFFKPRRIGKRFLVRPTWEDTELEAGDLEIVLDPGQAFGTGDHPTTRGCLALLEEVQVEGRDVLDLGCGSGILAIGAHKLGAKSVVGVDIEPVSVEVARENAELNGVDIEFIAGAGLEALPADLHYKLIVSNIISATLIRLAPDVSMRIPSGGDWIVSGILEGNWPDVLAAAEKNGFELKERRVEESWVAAWLQKK